MRACISVPTIVRSDGRFAVVEKLFKLTGGPTTLTFDDRDEASAIFSVVDDRWDNPLNYLIVRRDHRFFRLAELCYLNNVTFARNRLSLVLKYRKSWRVQIEMFFSNFIWDPEQWHPKIDSYFQISTIPYESLIQTWLSWLIINTSSGKQHSSRPVRC